MKDMIKTFFHCKECMEELPEGESPRSYARIQVGWTKKGLQVWCNRHEKNIIAVDFKGQKVAVDVGEEDGN